MFLLLFISIIYYDYLSFLKIFEINLNFSQMLIIIFILLSYYFTFVFNLMELYSSFYAYFYVRINIFTLIK